MMYTCRYTKEYTPPNYADCAIAAPYDPTDITPEIIGLSHPPRGIHPATLGMPVQKVGRTTGHTQDTITQINATVRVSYGAGRTATFHDQLIAGPMSAGGDSGSLVLDMDGYAVGLLFAGSDRVTIFSPIDYALTGLGVELVL